jgi:hypothetical protein
MCCSRFRMRRTNQVDLEIRRFNLQRSAYMNKVVHTCIYRDVYLFYIRKRLPY